MKKWKRKIKGTLNTEKITKNLSTRDRKEQKNDNGKGRIVEMSQERFFDDVSRGLCNDKRTKIEEKWKKKEKFVEGGLRKRKRNGHE